MQLQPFQCYMIISHIHIRDFLIHKVVQDIIFKIVSCIKKIAFCILKTQDSILSCLYL